MSLHLPPDVALAVLRHPWTVAALLLATLAQPAVVGMVRGYLRRARRTLPPRPPGAARGLARRASFRRTAMLLAAAFTLPFALVVPAGIGPDTAALGLILWLLALTDARSFLLPDRLTLPLLCIGLVTTPDTASALTGLLVWGGIPLALTLLYRRWRGIDGLGWGDVKLMAALGTWLGPLAGSIAIALAALAAGLFTIVVARRLGRPVGTHRAPFGVFLALGFWLAWLTITIA